MILFYGFVSSNSFIQSKIFHLLRKVRAETFMNGPTLRQEYLFVPIWLFLWMLPRCKIYMCPQNRKHKISLTYTDIKKGFYVSVCLHKDSAWYWWPQRLYWLSPAGNIFVPKCSGPMCMLLANGTNGNIFFRVVWSFACECARGRRDLWPQQTSWPH